MRTIGLMAIAVTVGLATVSMPAIVHAQDGKAQSQTVTLKVPDMFCGGCEAAVKMSAKKVPGVKAVKTDSAKRVAEVTFDPSRTNADAIAAAITKGSGFKTELPKSDKNKR